MFNVFSIQSKLIKNILCELLIIGMVTDLQKKLHLMRLLGVVERLQNKNPTKRFII